MEIKTLLVSQPVPANIDRSPYKELMDKHSLQVDFYPFIKVEAVSLKEFRSQRIEILEHPTVLFTSRATIDHFFSICEQARIVVPETMKYLCQSEAVALYLQKHIVYRKRRIFFADGTFEGFMELILKHRDERMLLTLAEPYNADVSSAMERLRLRFDRVVLSRTVSRDLSGIDPSKYDLMVFYTPAEIAALVEAFPPQTLPMIATMGGGTARAAAEAGIKVRAMAPTAQAPSMTRAIDLLISGELVEEPAVATGAAPGNKVDDFVRAHEPKFTRRKPVKPSAPASKPSAKNGAVPKPSTGGAGNSKPASGSAHAASSGAAKSSAKTSASNK